MVKLCRMPPGRYYHYKYDSGRESMPIVTFRRAGYDVALRRSCALGKHHRQGCINVKNSHGCVAD